MKTRIVSGTGAFGKIYIPQYKPSLLKQLLTFNFEWQHFYLCKLRDRDKEIRSFNSLDSAIKFCESAETRGKAEFNFTVV